MRLTRRGFLTGAALCGLIGGPGTSRLAAAAQPPAGQLDYRVLRNGSPVGRHRMEVSRTGATVVVTNDIALSVGLLGISLYRYAHVSTERWVGGELVALDSRTEKNGREKRLAGTRTDGRLVLTNQDGERRSFADSPVTTALWHPRTPFQQRLLEIEDGWLKRLESQDLGRAQVPVGERRVTARHFRLGGEIGRDVWYDDAGRLVRVEFDSDKDGSRIVVAARRISPEP